MPITAVPPSESGVSWFGVESITSFPPLTSNQAQPEPNRPTPAAASFVLKVGKSPKAELIAAARSPDGPVPPLTFRIGQKNEWFQCPPALLRTGPLIASGSESRLESNCSRVLLCKSGYGSSALLRLVT